MYAYLVQFVLFGTSPNAVSRKEILTIVTAAVFVAIIPMFAATLEVLRIQGKTISVLETVTNVLTPRASPSPTPQ